MREGTKTVAAVLASVVLGGIILIVFIKHLLPIFLPFLIAWATALAIRAPAKKVAALTKIPERITRLLLSFAVTVLLFGVISLVLWQLVGAIWGFLSDIGRGEGLYDILIQITNPSLTIFGDAIPPELSERISEAVRSLLSSALSSLASAVTSWVSVLPRAFIFLLVTLIALVYFNLDLERINAAVRAVLPQKVGIWLSKIRHQIFEVGLKYVKSYLLIMLITFVVMLFGFFILRVPRAPLIAVIVAVLDVLPIIGVGTVLVPWSVFEIATGNAAMGVGLIVLFLANEVIRQFAEPKIVGKNLNVHPLLTLVLLYFGYSLFGISGLVLIPIIIAVLGLVKKDESADVGK